MVIDMDKLSEYISLTIMRGENILELNIIKAYGSQMVSRINFFSLIVYPMYKLQTEIKLSAIPCQPMPRTGIYHQQ